MSVLTDSPITNVSDDLFNVEKYVNGLADFIISCETPNTIAIQGDWGSGKTSIMNMVREKLDGKVKSVWFNTWQFSKFNLDDHLSISLLSCLAQELSDMNDKKNHEIKNKIAVLTKLSACAIDFAGAQKAAEYIEQLGNNMTNDSGGDIVRIIQNLKENFQDSANQIYEKTGQKIVIFIDDLDRLEPAKAVDLLEVLKLFLDCKNCVYVLAIDYNVVTKGIEKKYGSDFKQGKSFFDKIIQVPFYIPLAQYDIQKYITQTMNNLGIGIDVKETEEYQNLIKNSVGCNPRAMKRLFNAFLLISKIFTEDKFEQDRNNKKMLFAALCLQLSFEPVYNYIIEQSDDMDVIAFEKFITDEKVSKQSFEDYFAGIDIDDAEYSLPEILAFMRAVCRILMDENEKISEKKLEQFKRVINTSLATNNVVVRKNNTSPELQSDTVVEKVIGATDYKYKICTCGSKLHIGFGKNIKIEYSGSEYPAKMHSSAKGRIDGMAKIYADNDIKQGDKLRLTYIYSKETIVIEKMQSK